jgi:hypothetical protein
MRSAGASLAADSLMPAPSAPLSTRRATRGIDVLVQAAGATGVWRETADRCRRLGPYSAVDLSGAFYADVRLVDRRALQARHRRRLSIAAQMCQA